MAIPELFDQLKSCRGRDIPRSRLLESVMKVSAMLTRLGPCRARRRRASTSAGMRAAVSEALLLPPREWREVQKYSGSGNTTGENQSQPTSSVEDTGFKESTTINEPCVRIQKDPGLGMGFSTAPVNVHFRGLLRSHSSPRRDPLQRSALRRPTLRARCPVFFSYSRPCRTLFGGTENVAEWSEYPGRPAAPP